VADLARLEALPPLLARRARHIISENARVLEAREALVREELPRFGELLNASHDSLRDDYEVSIAALDLLVTLARALPYVLGARMTGGGFGGAMLIAVRAGDASSVARLVADQYLRQTGGGATILIPRP
jgi:galactokinase